MERSQEQGHLHGLLRQGEARISATVFGLGLSLVFCGHSLEGDLELLGLFGFIILVHMFVTSTVHRSMSLDFSLKGFSFGCMFLYLYLNLTKSVMSLSVTLLVWGLYGIKLSPLKSMSDSVLVRQYEDRLTIMSCLWHTSFLFLVKRLSLFLLSGFYSLVFLGFLWVNLGTLSVVPIWWVVSNVVSSLVGYQGSCFVETMIFVCIYCVCVFNVQVTIRCVVY